MAERAVADVMRSVRDQHISKIIRTLLRSPQSRKQLTESTRISFNSITRLVSLLIDTGYIEPVVVESPGRHKAGRPEVPLRIRSDNGRVVIGTQIQGVIVTVDAFTLDGQRLSSHERPHTNRSPAAVLRSATSLTRRVLADLGPDRVLGVGVSTGGQVELASGRLITNPRLGWADVDLRGPFDRAVQCPVTVDNSVRSLAAERLLWSPWSARTMLAVVVAGAISSALVVDGALYRGATSTAGDITHFPVSGRPGFECQCGTDSCANSTLTNRALHGRAVRAGLVGADEPWESVFKTGSRRLDALRRERAVLLGQTLGHLNRLTDPAVTIVAGRIGTDDDLQAMAEASGPLPSNDHGLSPAIHHWNVTEHEWGAGAAALAMDDFLSRPTAYDGRLFA